MTDGDKIIVAQLARALAAAERANKIDGEYWRMVTKFIGYTQSRVYTLPDGHSAAHAMSDAIRAWAEEGPK